MTVSDDKAARHEPAWVAKALGDRPYRFLWQTASTNDDASAWLGQGAPDGAVVLADEQTSGRGRRGRSWLAAPGTSLLMSVIVRPEIPPARLPCVNLAGAVVLADVLAEYHLSPAIKWPNDVLLGGRKVAGILGEAAWSGAILDGVILGLGINVLSGALPGDAAERFQATTLEAALGYPPDRGDLLARLLARLDHWVFSLADDNLLAAWRGYNVTLDRRVTASAAAETLVGLAEDIDETGALLLQLDDGRLCRLLAGEVTIRERR